KHVVLASCLAVVAAGCGSSSSSPTTPSGSAVPKFSATLSPANETPAITNADSTGSGSVIVTLNVTKDSSGNVTAATADFSVPLSGVPGNTSLTAAQIHAARAGIAGGIVVQTGLSAGEITLANGSGSFTKTGNNVPPDVAQSILNDPAGFYFNVHTTLNT